MKFAGVIVDISHEQLDKTFQYIIPEHLYEDVRIGSRVRIPFGRSERTGYVVEITEEPELSLDKLKEIKSVVKGSIEIEENLIRLAYWMKTNYGSTINQALKTVIPVKEKVKETQKKTIHLLIAPQEAVSLAMEAEAKHRVAQSRLLKALAENPITDFALLNQKLNINLTTVKSLEERGVLEISTTTMLRNVIETGSGKDKRVELNPQQKYICDSINAEIEKGDNRPCLIKGVTGSGKTEIYMQLIADTIEKGREAIVLIPEIALTYQTVMRFYNRFGDVVSIINSRLSKGEKYDRFNMAKEGRIKIMIGPRSALFTPFLNLGLIIIDEEHESAYKSETVPKYHARETAIEIARMNNAKVILGSATPSLEAYYNAKKGNYSLYTLDARAGKGTMPKVHVVDLREEMKRGNRSVFSNKLLDLIEDRLAKKEQIMLFLNRRGYKGFINCRDCGHIIECPHCAISMTEHKGNRLVCHYCGHEEPFLRVCPNCGSKHVGTFKAGTEKIEEEAHKLFPDARILRMDYDTTRGKDGHSGILEQFANCEADILIGTQMIVKGHDFSNVTLVGILLADMSLHASDYMASERTFELLTQAAGRAGRGDKPGEVVIQTYDPEHYSIIHAANQDYDAFYEEEIAYRDMMDYPPVMHLLSVRIASENESMAVKVSEIIKDKTVGAYDDLKIIGPANASIYKINDIYYRIIYYKHGEYGALTAIKDRINDLIKSDEEVIKNCQIQFDFR